MTNEQLQQVVDKENERLNKIALEKATVRLQDIAAINASIARLQTQRAAVQKEIAELKFDSVTVADVIGEGAATTEG